MAQILKFAQPIAKDGLCACGDCIADRRKPGAAFKRIRLWIEDKPLTKEEPSNE